MNWAKQATVMVLLALILGVTPPIARVASAAAQPASVVINEFMANNRATLKTATGNYSDWIELYNPNGATVDVSGFFLTDNLSDYRWQIPANTTIAAHGYLLVWADNDIRQGLLHANFELNAQGESVGLFDKTGALIDSVTYDKQIADVSYGRPSDGAVGWKYLVHPSPDGANVVTDESYLIYPWQVWAAAVLVAAVVCVALLSVWRRKR
jgi:hypothetical protein